MSFSSKLSSSITGIEETDATQAQQTSSPRSPLQVKYYELAGSDGKIRVFWRGWVLSVLVCLQNKFPSWYGIAETLYLYLPDSFSLPP